MAQHGYKQLELVFLLNILYFTLSFLLQIRLHVASGGKINLTTSITPVGVSTNHHHIDSLLKFED